MGFKKLKKFKQLTLQTPTTSEEPKLIKIRVWAAKEMVEDTAELFVENAESNGLRLIEKSAPYPC